MTSTRQLRDQQNQHLAIEIIVGERQRANIIRSFGVYSLNAIKKTSRHYSLQLKSNLATWPATLLKAADDQCVRL